MSTRSIILIILACAITIISIQNMHPVSLKIFFWNLELPLIILTFFVLLAGFTIGYTVGTLSRGRHMRRDRPAQEMDNRNTE